MSNTNVKLLLKTVMPNLSSAEDAYLDTIIAIATVEVNKSLFDGNTEDYELALAYKTADNVDGIQKKDNITSKKVGKLELKYEANKTSYYKTKYNELVAKYKKGICVVSL